MAEQIRPSCGENNTAESISLSAGSSPSVAFDIASCRLSQDFVSMGGIQKPLLNVPVRRPDKQWWFLVHPDIAYRGNFAVIEIAEENEHFLVAPGLQQYARGEYVAKLLITCQTRQGTTFLWPIRLPDEFGKLDTWNQGAHRIVQSHPGQWIRVTANRQVGGYDSHVMVDQSMAPIWPDCDFDTILRRAFDNKIINDIHHPVLRKLRGEA